jgi:arginine/lysine/ornithine decarboxylase
LAELPIVEAVIKYAKEKNALFCTPGHKGGRGFKSLYFKEFVDHAFEFDFTEVEGLDNLHSPEEAIKKSNKLLSELYGSYKSYFLINGSTLGNLIMIFSCFNEGDKILIERNCHKSIYNAVVLRKLKPIFIKNVLNEKLNVPLTMDVEHFLYNLKLHRDIKGAVITYPNYYGLCCDLKFIIGKCKEENVKVLVDSAHGAHFGICESLPESAVKLGADMVVTSAHKTLPSLTQTAYLHIGENVNSDKVNYYFNAFSSTSPSYIFLCSLDYARFYLDKYGKEEYNSLIKIADYYRDKINLLDHIHIIGKKDIMNDEFKKNIHDIDTTRYVINLDKGYSGHLLLKYLRKNGVQAEMSDESNVVLILSPFNTVDEFEKLYILLKKCDLTSLAGNTYDIVNYEIPELKILPADALNSDKKNLNYFEAEGEICGESIIPYPPGIPLLMMGEEVSRKHIEIINDYIENDVKVIGVNNKKISVLDIRS